MSELLAVAEAVEKVRHDDTSAGAIAERLRARVNALEQAPDEAGWEWLAERGDEGAALVVEYERSLLTKA